MFSFSTDHLSFPIPIAPALKGHYSPWNLLGKPDDILKLAAEDILRRLESVYEVLDSASNARCVLDFSKVISCLMLSGSSGDGMVSDTVAVQRVLIAKVRDNAHPQVEKLLAFLLRQTGSTPDMKRCQIASKADRRSDRALPNKPTVAQQYALDMKAKLRIQNKCHKVVKPARRSQPTGDRLNSTQRGFAVFYKDFISAGEKLISHESHTQPVGT
jgi:hypothetical protein